MADPECIITNDQLSVHTWEQIVADGKAKAGNQIWVGPAAGGLDHVTVMKVWEKAGFKAKWVAFASGGKAVAALLGEQGVAYVGNPRDIIGKAENLKIAAVVTGFDGYQLILQGKLGVSRFAFGIPRLFDGFALIPALIHGHRAFSKCCKSSSPANRKNHVGSLRKSFSASKSTKSNFQGIAGYSRGIIA